MSPSSSANCGGIQFIATDSVSTTPQVAPPMAFSIGQSHAQQYVPNLMASRSFFIKGQMAVTNHILSSESLRISDRSSSTSSSISVSCFHHPSIFIPPSASSNSGSLRHPPRCLRLRRRHARDLPRFQTHGLPFILILIGGTLLIIFQGSSSSSSSPTSSPSGGTTMGQLVIQDGIQIGGLTPHGHTENRDTYKC